MTSSGRRRCTAASGWGANDADESSSSDELAAISGWGTADLDAVFRRPRVSCDAPLRSKKSRPKATTTTTRDPQLPRLQLAKAQSTSSLVPTRATVQEQFALKYAPPAPVGSSDAYKSFGVRGCAVPTPVRVSSRERQRVPFARRPRATDKAAKPPASCKIVALVGDAEEWRPPTFQASGRRSDAAARVTLPRPKRDDAMRLVFPSLFGSHSLESLLSALTLSSSSEQQQQLLRAALPGPFGDQPIGQLEHPRLQHHQQRQRQHPEATTHDTKAAASAASDLPALFQDDNNNNSSSSSSAFGRPADAPTRSHAAAVGKASSVRLRNLLATPT